MELPRKFDIRESEKPHWRADVFCDGVKLDMCVAYDLDNKTAVVWDNKDYKYTNIFGEIVVVEIKKQEI